MKTVLLCLSILLPAAFTFQSTTTSLEVPELKSAVTVVRDARGIPYIQAANEHDLYFAQGYVTASDRLWQMDLMRRRARGRVAEILGPAALDGDRQHRILGFAQVVDQTLPHLEPLIRESLDAYAAGVNAYIAGLTPDHLPAEFRILQYQPEEWKPADSLLIGKLLAETLSTSYPVDVMREVLSPLPAAVRAALMPVTSPLDVVLVGSDKKAPKRPGGKGAGLARNIVPQIPGFDPSLAGGADASNNWVVSGGHSDTGMPLLANDPHLAPSAPSIWYLTELNAPGIHVAGVTTPGIPGILLGHNDHIAWGCTNLPADVQDLYRESFDPSNPNRYQTPEGWREASVRHETINVRGGAPVTIDVVTTRHGPIVIDDSGRKLALRWTALDPDDSELPAFYRINRAFNWNEFVAALKTYPGPAQNFVYADTDGHIGYYGAGKIPIRAHGDGSVPYDGTKDDGEWKRYIPFESLPHLFDPQAGAIVTANNRIVGTDYPFHITDDWSHPNRARRIQDMLFRKAKVGMDDMRGIQMDTISIAGRRFVEDADKLVPGLLPSWDGNSNANSTVGVLVSALRNAMERRILSALGGPALLHSYTWQNDAFLDRLLDEQPKALLPREFKDYAGLLRASFKDAQEDLTKQYGADRSRWVCGQIHPARFPHPLAALPTVGAAFAIPPFPQNGSGACGAGPTVNVGANVSMRMVADISNWDNTRQGIALGESGDPASPHWKDQLEEWRDAAPKRFPFTAEAIQKAAVGTLTLQP